MKDFFLLLRWYAYFTVGTKKIYLQKEGFAMGSYDSGKSEYFMQQDKFISSRLMFFFRFIDDGSMAIVMKPKCLSEILKKIVSFCPKEFDTEFKRTIRF